ncbi:hypothetical protein RND71_002869 [Anisodus tanguticus]|uniref:Protein BIG GRAIN 1-like E n=1 Tax=Anisodus tanguticus TaxID=243964 RepID=A0AAE1SSB1_9SOLA|nr:hypothetical protein RND71_002869 [Anisodus tanguticus]
MTRKKLTVEKTLPLPGLMSSKASESGGLSVLGRNAPGKASVPEKPNDPESLHNCLPLQTTFITSSLLDQSAAAHVGAVTSARSRLLIMSITGIHPESTNEKMSKKIIQWRNNSGEIDVFEAAKYFSGVNEEYYFGYNNNNQMLHNKQQNLRGGRMSFDMPMMRNSSSLLPSQTTYHIMDQKPKNKKDQKKYKQPSSPGGRLASFLNSIFNQTSSKKKKSSQSLKDQEDESPSGRRKRRSTISHFSFRSSSNITTTTTTTTNSTTNSTSSDSKSSSNSGFRTPPPYAPTPTKSYKDFKSFGLGKQQHEVYGDKKNATDYSWLDEKLKLSKNNGVYYSDKYNKNTNNGLLLSEKSKTYNKVVDVDVDVDVDDDADSDSSSDLFDLPNIDLDYYSSSGLPVYETTHMDNIKRGAPISSGSI